MKEYNNPKIVGENIEKNIWRARIYHTLLSRLFVGLRDKKLYQESTTLFGYLEEACITEYILCLSKIFGDTKESSLWQMLKIVENSSEADFESKLKLYPNAPHDSLRHARKNLLKDFKNIEEKVKKIKKKLKPLRNTDRAHSIPWMPKTNKKTSWNTSLEWLNFAAQLLEQSMDSLCEGVLRANQYYSDQFDEEIAHFIKSINVKIGNASNF